MEKSSMTPKEIRESLKESVDSLMVGPSYSLMLTVAEGEGLAITGGAIDMVPDYRQLGRALYKVLEDREDYGEAFALLLQGIDDMIQKDDMSNVLMQMASHGCSAAS